MSSFDAAQAARVGADEFLRACPPPDAEWYVEGSIRPILITILTALAERAYAAGYEERHAEGEQKYAAGYEAGYTEGQRRAFEYYALSKPGFASTTNRNPSEDIHP